jgi:hypothetical protein
MRGRRAHDHEEGLHLFSGSELIVLVCIYLREIGNLKTENY